MHMVSHMQTKGTHVLQHICYQWASADPKSATKDLPRAFLPQATLKSILPVAWIARHLTDLRLCVYIIFIFENIAYPNLPGLVHQLLRCLLNLWKNSQLMDVEVELDVCCNFL